MQEISGASGGRAAIIEKSADFDKTSTVAEGEVGWSGQFGRAGEPLDTTHEDSRSILRRHHGQLLGNKQVRTSTSYLHEQSRYVRSM